MLNKEDIVQFRIPEDAVLDTKDKTIGRIAGSVKYNECDLYLTTFKMQSLVKSVVSPDKIISDFYAWDAALAEYYNKSTAIHKFKQIKEQGINKAVELDFSVFYDQPAILNLYNIHYCNKRTRDMINMGFKIIVNGNLITSKFFEVNDYYLPLHIKTIVFDNNHRFNETYINLEIDMLNKLYSKRTVDNAIFICAKKSKAYLLPILKVLESHNTSYCFIPPRAAVIQSYLKNKMVELERS